MWRRIEAKGTWALQIELYQSLIALRDKRRNVQMLVTRICLSEVLPITAPNSRTRTQPRSCIGSNSRIEDVKTFLQVLSIPEDVVL